MIKAFDSTTRTFGPAETLAGAAWLHVVAPTPEELARLDREAHLPARLAAHALDADELARLHRAGDVALVVIEAPHAAAPGARQPFLSVPLGVFIRPGKPIITMSAFDCDVVAGLLGREEIAIDRPARFLRQLLLAVAQRYLQHLRIIDRSVDELEDRLSSSQRNQEVIELLRHQKSLVLFTTALEQDEQMLERLDKDPELAPGDGDRPLADEVLTELRQARDMTRVASEMLSNTMDAFASIISNNLNVVMKVLTSLTLILMIPNLVFAFYGMNVRLPLAHSPSAAAIVLLACVLVVSAGLLFFRRKRWI